MEKCKRCLLREAGENVKYAEILSYLETVKNDLTDEKTAAARLEYCTSCDELISGTCRQCGCYVEIRARLKDGACPKEKW